MFEFDANAKEKPVTVCLVRGNPETAGVWNRLAPLLDGGPVVRLSPPGFGAPVPRGSQPRRRSTAVPREPARTR
jgi:hypothetical protein